MLFSREVQNILQYQGGSISTREPMAYAEIESPEPCMAHACTERRQILTSSKEAGYRGTETMYAKLIDCSGRRHRSRPPRGHLEVQPGTAFPGSEIRHRCGGKSVADTFRAECRRSLAALCQDSWAWQFETARWTTYTQPAPTERHAQGVCVRVINIRNPLVVVRIRRIQCHLDSLEVHTSGAWNKRSPQLCYISLRERTIVDNLIIKNHHLA
ncbi:hypothetical protein BC834DRAFT_890072 [Gloeopeniophorella convolvens]|nr:hypothetical protein BC834DRAFT_890072 [Gloeopeniophorella convolvens]